MLDLFKAWKIKAESPGEYTKFENEMMHVAFLT